MLDELSHLTFPGEWTVFVINVVAASIWGTVLYRERDRFRGRRPFPEGVRIGLLVTVVAALTGGGITALGFAHVLDTTQSAIVGAAWRSAIMVAGIYALIASLRDNVEASPTPPNLRSDPPPDL